MAHHISSSRSAAPNDGLGLVAAAALPAVSLALAYASYVLFDQLGGVGPLDKAKLAWLVTVPLVAAAPGLGAAALTAARIRRGLIAVGAVSAGAALFTVWLLASTETRIGCYVVRSVWELIPNAAFVGLVAGLSLFGASAIAARVGQRTHAHPGLMSFGVGSVLGVVGGAATLFALSVAFPAVSCAPPI